MRGILIELNKRYRNLKNAKIQEILRSLKEKEAELKRKPGKKNC